MANRTALKITSNKMVEIPINQISTSAKVEYLEKMDANLQMMIKAYNTMVEAFYDSEKYGEDFDNWLEKAIENDYPEHWMSFDEEAMEVINWAYEMRMAIGTKIDQLKGNE